MSIAGRSVVLGCALGLAAFVHLGQARAGSQQCAAALKKLSQECAEATAKAATADAAREALADTQQALASLAPNASALDLEQARQAVRTAEAEVKAVDAARAHVEAFGCEYFPEPKSATPCEPLAQHLYILLDPKGAPKEQRAATATEVLEPETVTSVNSAGTAGQLDPVAGLRTVTLAGGAVALAGTTSGTQAVATLTINPLAFGAEDEDARLYQRFADLSVTVPFDLGADAEQSAARLVGVRLRLNFAAQVQVGALTSAYDTYLQAEGAYVDAFVGAMRASADPEACFKSSVEARAIATGPCGFASERDVLDAAYAAARLEMEKVRVAADAAYYGLDLRADIADRTAEADSGDTGFRLVGGLAAGRRFEGATWSIELRGRAAVDYFDPRAQVDLAGEELSPVFSADFGAGLLLSTRPSARLSKQHLSIGVGVEGRYAGSSSTASEATARTDFTDLLTTILVPAAGGSDLAITLRVPIDDSAMPRGTSVAVTGDFGIFASQPEPVN